MEDNNDSKSKKNKLTIVIAISFLLALISMLLLIVVIKEEAALKGADQAIRLSAQGGFECEYAEAQKLYPFQEGVLKVTSSRIAYLTLAGNEVYSLSVNYSNPSCIIQGNTALVIDIDGYSFSLLDGDGVVYSKPTSNKIKAATISETGMIAIITDSAESYGEVIVYDSFGSILSTWSSNDSGYPISCAFNSDASKLAVSTVNTSGAEYRASIKVFAYNESYSGIQVSNFATYKIDNPDIISTVFYVDDELFGFSSSYVYEVVDNVLTSITTDMGAIINVTRFGNNICIVYADGINQLNKLAIITSSGATIYNSDIGSNLNAVNCDSSRFVISIDRRIFIFNRDGSIIADISVDEDLLQVGFIGNNKLVVVSTSGVHTIDY